MSIEIKQMTVKASVGEEKPEEKVQQTQNTNGLCNDLEKEKGRIISECKELFIELLNRERDR